MVGKWIFLAVLGAMLLYALTLIALVIIEDVRRSLKILKEEDGE